MFPFLFDTIFCSVFGHNLHGVGVGKIIVPPSAGVFIMAIVYAFYLLSLCVAIWYAVKHKLFHRMKLVICRPREHKPTKSERIAELERQVAELTKEKDAE